MADQILPAELPSLNIDTIETRRIANEAISECFPIVLPILFPLRHRNSRSRTRILSDGREVLSGYAYEKRRREVLRRDSFHCVACGSSNSVAVHHRRKRSVGRDDRMENLITLCELCHRAEHQE